MNMLLIALLYTAQAVVDDCSVPNSIFKIQELTFSPSQPVIGENTTLYVKFNNPGEPVLDGTVTTAIKYNFLPLSPDIQPLCQNTACPVPVGVTEQSSSSLWPDLSGIVDIRITWTDTNNNQLMCMHVKESAVQGDINEGIAW